MRKIAAAKFKEQCLQILDRVDPEGIIITKHGKPVAKVLPFRPTDESLIGALKDKLKIKAKSLLSTGERWNAES